MLRIRIRLGLEVNLMKLAFGIILELTSIREILSVSPYI